MSPFLLYSSISFFGLVYVVQSQKQLGLHYNDSTRHLNTEDCTQVSIVSDATYCIHGQICSGNGSFPMGYECPRRGDIATAHCSERFKSYRKTDSKCIAPVNSFCKRANSGVWTCVWGDAEQDLASKRPQVTSKYKNEKKNRYDKPRNKSTPVRPSMYPIISSKKPRDLEERLKSDTPTMNSCSITHSSLLVLGSRRPSPSGRLLLQHENTQYETKGTTTVPKLQKPMQ
jgi:hypothetical protein